MRLKLGRPDIADHADRFDAPPATGPWGVTFLGVASLLIDDGHIVTPETGTILEGITRSSIIELAGKLGHQVEERKFSIDEWRDGVASGEITEVFACGTAAVVTPVGTLKWRGGQVGEGETTGPVTQEVRTALVDIQYGRAEDTFGWMHRVV